MMNGTTDTLNGAISRPMAKRGSGGKKNESQMNIINKLYRSGI
jgi:hypothetical protein